MLMYVNNCIAGAPGLFQCVYTKVVPQVIHSIEQYIFIYILKHNIYIYPYATLSVIRSCKRLHQYHVIPAELGCTSS